MFNMFNPHESKIIQDKKNSKDVPDLILPARVVQIIPNLTIHFELVEVHDLDTTSRNEGSFGSTGR